MNTLEAAGSPSETSREPNSVTTSQPNTKILALISALQAAINDGGNSPQQDGATTERNNIEGIAMDHSRNETHPMELDAGITIETLGQPKPVTTSRPNAKILPLTSPLQEALNDVDNSTQHDGPTIEPNNTERIAENDSRDKTQPMELDAGNPSETSREPNPVTTLQPNAKILALISALQAAINDEGNSPQQDGPTTEPNNIEGIAVDNSRNETQPMELVSAEEGFAACRRRETGDILLEFDCGECEEIFRSLDSLRAHILQNHNCSTGLTKYTCDLCQATFTLSHNLERHKRKAHEGNLMAFCNLCSASFTSKGYLNQHRKRQHPDDISNRTCDICNATFPFAANMRLHKYRMHRGYPSTF